MHRAPAATPPPPPTHTHLPPRARSENKRGRGFGRCILEAIEEISRALGLGRLLLCSTVEAHVQATWKHLGFIEATEADLEALDVRDQDLIHMSVRGPV